MIGVPLGRNLLSGATLCADPISWFERANLIGNPSAFLLGLPGLGKCLNVDTPMPTPTGCTPMGNLKVGDHVFDEHGQPTVIVAASEVMTHRECLEVCFSDGSTIVADAEHLWVTQTRTDRTRPGLRAKRGPAVHRRVGDEQQLAAVRVARAATGPAVTTRRRLTRELGWKTPSSDEARVTRASYRQESLGRDGWSLLYDRARLLEDLERMLESHWNDHNLASEQRVPITTRQLAATVRVGPERRARHAIPVAPALELPEADLPLAPRLLGLWLGDGDSRAAGFTTADPELLEDFAAAGWPARHSARYRYTLSTPRDAPVEPGRMRWLSQLRAIGVFGNKHIPAVYLRGSIAQRRALLSGLLDTDGTVHREGLVQYTTTLPDLAGDVAELICSLGYRATTTEGRSQLYGVDHGPAWTINFTTCDVVFGLERKRDAHRERQRVSSGARRRLRYITDVRPVSSVPMRCIQVANPSGMFLAGRSFIATHNSTLVRRMALGLTGYGTMPLVLGDLKPDYVDLIEALGGQVIRLGRGRGYLNILDPGEATAAADRLTGRARDEVIADARGRRHTMVCALITILRNSPPTDREESLLVHAISILDRDHIGIPVLADLIQVIHDAPDELRHVAMDRGDMTRYLDVTEGLLVTLAGLLGQGRVGEMFSQQTTTPMQMGVPVVFDVSSIPDTEPALQGAALMACWASGFGSLNVANALTDAGLQPQQRVILVLDELWRAIRSGQGMVDRIDGLTRLNRQHGVGQIMISHTMSDLESLADASDVQKARGFVERAGMMICGGLPAGEMPKLTRVVPFSEAEQEMLVAWQDPPAWDPIAGQQTAPPGRGNFLIKVGGRPGIPLHVTLTETELALNDTNRRWAIETAV